MTATSSFLPLKEGSTGQKVTIIQEFLKALKLYAGAIDGIFGPQTKAAVTKFQQSKKLSVDGIVGTKTAIALDDAVWLSQRQTLQQGSKGEQVETLQGMFNYSNYGDIVVDGIFGPKTKALVMKFQGDRGLKVDGIVGPLTWDSLRTLATHDIPIEQRIEEIFS